MIKKTLFIVLMIFFAYSFSMCKIFFSATSETVNETYLSLVLSRTGQTTCYDSSDQITSCLNTTGQDGNYQRGAAWPNPRFINHGNGTVTDRLTGLMWQQDGNISGIKTWQQALDYIVTLNNSQYLGYSDWRLPNINELYSLMMHFGLLDNVSWLNSQGFNNIQSVSGYWSSTTNAFSPSEAWFLNTSTKSPVVTSKVTSYYIIAVRAGYSGAISIPTTGQTTCYDSSDQITSCSNTTGQDGNYQKGVVWPNPRFINHGNGTVTDRLTGLMWQQDGGVSGTRDWQQALDYIVTLNNSRYLGYSDWRLPNVNELRSLINYETSDVFGWLNSQGFIDVQAGGQYWSSSTRVASASFACYVNLTYGQMVGFSKSYTYSVLAVRGGY